MHQEEYNSCFHYVFVQFYEMLVFDTMLFMLLDEPLCVLSLHIFLCFSTYIICISCGADNLLLTENHKSVKLADFGLAREETVTEMMTAETGTYRWMAPEVPIY